MLQKSTIQHLRFHFSLCLSPIFFFALSTAEYPLFTLKTGLLFFILHILIYPSSNGYNSYMDQDTNSIGGIKNPLPTTKQLFFTSVFMDVCALLLALFFEWSVWLALLFYIITSRAYSYRGIRLKKYGIISFLIIAFFQGSLVFFITTKVAQIEEYSYPILLAAAALLISSFYPNSQIYQHEQERADGVSTISMLLGYRGTFVFSGTCFAIANSLLAYYYFSQLEWNYFFLLQTIMLPVLLYFMYWFVLVWRNSAAANFKHTMRLNFMAAIFTNIAFLTIIILKNFG